MKKYFLLLTLALCHFLLQAQDYNSIKNLAVLGNYQAAKDKLDVAITDAAFAAKPEAYLLKATVYSGLAGSANVKGTASADGLITAADAAFTKYCGMDAGLVLLNDQVYQTAPISIYSALYTAGYTEYQNKNWQAGFIKLKKVVEYSDLMYSKKLINTPLDTNALVLAGLVAENAGFKNDAAKYYSRLADAGIGGEGFESVYRYLVSYYFAQNNTAPFEKYRAAGKKVFPQSEYFNYDRVDFAVGLETDFNKKIQALDNILATEPNNEKANEVMGELIYDTLNPAQPGSVLPAGAAQLEAKMIRAFHKAASLRPDNAIPFIYVGNHFINKGIAIKDDETKTGSSAAKEQQYGVVVEDAREDYEKAAAIYAAKTTLTKADKQQYKKITGLLADIAAYKKLAAKGNAAEETKYAEAEKKWNALYESIR